MPEDARRNVVKIANLKRYLKRASRSIELLGAALRRILEKTKVKNRVPGFSNNGGRSSGSGAGSAVHFRRSVLQL